MHQNTRKVNPEDDLGFGKQPVMKSQPVINKDGTINVKRTGLPFFNSLNSYQTMITMSWTKFWIVVLSGYMVANITFACIYVSLGTDSLDGKSGTTFFDHFMDAFFFSAQTISTVGYGHISPQGMAANCVAALESMIGLLAFALATGLLYGRFSRPTAKIRYSNNILISPYLENKRGLMFRLANVRRNILIDLEMEVLFSYNDEVNGKTERKFFPLPLERRAVSILTLNWTVVHPIDDDSPLKDFTQEDYKKAEVVFSVILKTFDDTFAQTVHSRTTYTYKDMVWNAKFKPTFDRDEDGRVVLHLENINTYEVLD
ncbi:ion channel [Mucilaginibacter sp. SP1R1]|uniref:ion channel n=1 Tax=Mucilaginibacter sp. SP1R1 TaxID=2723091 RepID=UPI0016105736|nr:ion channel [Mucilaginibacter sp. SP1R1]MBB6148061.1 inward rectifier potassium channel [Mucilaginibacter sp. SP1R1]